MNLGELMAAAAAAKTAGTGLTLVLPSDGSRPARFPRGELRCVNPAGERVYSFKPQKVLEWITRQMGFTEEDQGV